MRLKNTIIYILLIFPYILDNASKGRYWDQTFRFFPFPRSVYLLYPAFYTIILIIILLNFLRSNKKLKPSPLFKIVLFAVLLSTLSALANGFTYVSILTINKYYRMFFVYIITYLFFAPSLFSIKRLNNISIFFMVISLTIAWFQIIVLNAKVDYVTGLSSTAHVFVLVMIFFLIYLTNYFLSKKKYFKLIFTLPIIIALFMASFAKANIIFIFSLVLYALVILKKRINIASVFKYTITGLLIISGFIFSLEILDKPTYNKLGLFINIRLSNVPYYNNIINTPRLLTKNIKTIIFGYGPGNFGSRSNLEEGKIAVKEFNKLHHFTYNIDTFGLSPSMKNPTSAMLAFLLENGLVIFLLYLYLLLFMYKKTIFIIRNNNGLIPTYLANSTLFVFLFFIIYNFIVPEHIFFISNLFTGFIFMYLAIVHKRFDMLQQGIKSTI